MSKAAISFFLGIQSRRSMSLFPRNPAHCSRKEIRSSNHSLVMVSFSLSSLQPLVAGVQAGHALPFRRFDHAAQSRLQPQP
ncbi:hypothetical protein E2C01_049405 [Portunus trituberculatus]|uniref:Uncharacterized protein n=1 Tax=Portunus trituberculatus TaxID=210409 RepID=A0A5B7GD23_PORTR|nr:hypothetical protein [Portunus trituberculatus]